VSPTWKVGAAVGDGVAEGRCMCGRSATGRVQACAEGGERTRTSRRAFLRVLGGWTLAALGIQGANAAGQNKTADGGDDKNKEPEKCKNCNGTGKVVCDLCSGTGFWRAIANKDPNLRYKGVVCPTCNGKGELTCLVCLGTGESNTLGMLRKRKIETPDGRILQS